MNVSLYWKNSDPRKVVSMIPTSAITGEGIPDLLQLVVKLTTAMMSEKLMFLGNILQCTVLEVKALEGLGTTIDVVLVNGELHEGKLQKKIQPMSLPHPHCLFLNLIDLLHSASVYLRQCFYHWSVVYKGRSAMNLIIV